MGGLFYYIRGDYMLKRIKRACKAFKNALQDENYNGAWYDFFNTAKDGKAINDTVYYSCMRIMSETIAKMPLKMFKEDGFGSVKAENYVFNMLSRRPNKFTTPSALWSAVMRDVKHTGNGYIYIRKVYDRKLREERVLDFWYLPSKNVTVYLDDKLIFNKSSGGVVGDAENLYYCFNDDRGKFYVFPSEDILHFKNSYSDNGIMGKSVLDCLSDTVEGSLKSQNFVNGLSENGLRAKALLKFTTDLNDDEVVEYMKKYKDYISGKMDNSILIPVLDGFEVQPLDLNLVNAQFLELKRYTALQIASAFGIKPDQINDYTKSSFASSEAQQLAFLVDTVLYDVKAFEEELNYKLLNEKERAEGYYFKFNEKVILRVDSMSQAEILSKYVNNGVYTPNEARAVLDLPSKDGGDTLVMNGNYIPITDVGRQYE